MAIIANRTTTYHYGKTSVHDQIAPGSGKVSPQDRPRGSAVIFRPAKPTRFYPATIIYHFGTSPVLPDRLSWNCQAAERTHQDQECCLLRVLTYNLMVVLLTFNKRYLSIFSTEHFDAWFLHSFENVRCRMLFIWFFGRENLRVVVTLPDAAFFLLPLPPPVWRVRV